MKKVFIFLLTACLCLLMTGCRTCRQLTSSETETRHDSIRTEYRERVTFVPDTVYIQIPEQRSELTTADSLSHLENDYAVSDVRLLPNGQLRHTLATKPQQKPVETTAKVIRQDSVVYRDRWQTKTKTVVRERKQPWYEKAQIWGFRGLLAAVLIYFTIKIIPTLIRRIRGK